MKKLVLGALLAAIASSTGCIISSSGDDGGPPPPTNAVVTARWSFNTYANRMSAPTGACPANFATASVHAKPWDPVLGDYVAGGTEVVDKFNCSDKVGTTDPLDGIYQIWVQIESDSGASIYAQSAAEYFDTANGDKTIDLPTLFTDAGYFDLSWDLLRSPSTARLTCAEAGIGSNGSISTSAVIAGSSTAVVDKFTCTDGFGVTDELPVGTYDVTVTATSSASVDLGASLPITKSITAPSGLTHLGHVHIPVQ